MESPELAELAEAVIVWTGWGRSACPRRDRTRLEGRFGSERAVRLLERIQRLESEFYESDASTVAADLVEMGTLAEARFNGLHPDLPEIVGRAFAWCYTFDFK